VTATKRAFACSLRQFMEDYDYQIEDAAFIDMIPDEVIAFSRTVVSLIHFYCTEMQPKHLVS
jgi:hypothetical protein